ncbi:MAG TPA: hypothetical protein VMU31_06960 [Rhizomicrobium sp.]|nr:hypothetical protein [Rhizomicrobium sp.]
MTKFLGVGLAALFMAGVLAPASAAPYKLTVKNNSTSTQKPTVYQAPPPAPVTSGKTGAKKKP